MHIVRDSCLLAVVLTAIGAPGIAGAPGVAAADNRPPPPPVLMSPAHGARVPLLRPALVFENAVDPDGDALIYEWGLSPTLDFLVLEDSGTAPPTSGSTTTELLLSADLAEDTRHCWRARANDGQATSAYSVACFLASARNAPPTVPVLNNPSDNMAATTTTPVFSWQPSTDVEDEPITYDIEVRDEAEVLVGSVSGVSGTVTSIAAELENEASYTWSARAVDRSGAMSAFSPVNTFSVNAPCGGCPEVILVDDGGCSSESSSACQASRSASRGTAVALGLGLVGFLGRRRRRRR